MGWRRALTTVFAATFFVVSASFAYGIYLLSLVPAAAPAPPPPSARQPPDVKALLDRARAHAATREVEQALVAYRRVLFEQDSAEAQLGLAEAEALAGRGDIATLEYERLLRIDSRSLAAHLYLAKTGSRRREDWPRAEAHYREYLSLRRDEPEAQLGLARLLAWQGRGSDAVPLYELPEVQKALTSADRRDYAMALVSARRGAEAEPLLVRLLDAGPGDREVALALAGLRASRGDWDRALPLYRAVLKARPEDPEVNLALGQGLLAQGDAAGAIEPLRQATRGMPSHREAALAYARAARGARALELADAEFARAAALHEGNPAVAREYADLLMDRRNYRKAETLYRIAHAGGLRDDGLLVAWAGALAANNKPREAVPLLEQVYARAPTERLAFDLARLCKRIGRNDRALELLAQIGQSRK